MKPQYATSRKYGHSLTVSLVLLIIFSCDELEPVNPADPAYKLDSPTLLSVETLTDTQIEITWKDNEEHSKEFVISRKSGSGAFSTAGTVAKDILTFTDTACVLEVEYSYVVQSKVESNVSAHSNSLIKATTFPGPMNLSARSLSDSELLLNWIDNTSYEEGFKIERDTGSGFTEHGMVSSDVTEYTDSGLIFGHSYEYRVAAYTSLNMSRWATIAAATEFPAPSDLVASSLSDSEIELTWTDNTDYESGFRIERNVGNGFTEIGAVFSDVTEYTDTGLTFGHSYGYRVAAYTSMNTSEHSEEVTATACLSCVVDVDGNLYETIRIGDQLWMADNLEVTHYRDGTAITTDKTDAEWATLTTGAYCINNNNASNEVDTYGALYNWYAVDDNRNIAPEGWHVPSDAEWKELEVYLGMDSTVADESYSRGTNEGSKLAGNAELWDSGALENDSEFGSSGFTALPGGDRSGYNGSFWGLGFTASFWSATDNGAYAWYRKLYNSRSDIDRRQYYYKGDGFSIRCVKD